MKSANQRKHKTPQSSPSSALVFHIKKSISHDDYHNPHEANRQFSMLYPAENIRLFTCANPNSIEGNLFNPTLTG